MFCMKIRCQGTMVPAVKDLNNCELRSPVLDINNHLKSKNMVITKELIN